MKKTTRFRFSKKFMQSLKGREDVAVIGRGWAVLDHGDGYRTLIELVNIVTNEGDKFYAQSAMGETPSVDFLASAGGLRLGTGTSSPTKSDTDVNAFLSGSGHAIKTNYPMTDDQDGDNTGAGVDIATWTYEYLTSEGNGSSIAEGAIVNDRATPTAALSHFLFAAPFTKTSSDTLKVIVNHQFNGV